MKKLSILLAIFFLASYAILPTISFADLSEDVDSLISAGDGDGGAGVTTIKNALFNASMDIFDIIRVAGIVVALIIIAAFGISWLVATPAKKAELKGKLWNIVIGIVILVAATQILSMFVDFVENTSKTLESETGAEGEGDTD